MRTPGIRDEQGPAERRPLSMGQEIPSARQQQRALWERPGMTAHGETPRLKFQNLHFHSKNHTLIKHEIEGSAEFYMEELSLGNVEKLALFIYSQSPMLLAFAPDIPVPLTVSQLSSLAKRCPQPKSFLLPHSLLFLVCLRSHRALSNASPGTSRVHPNLCPTLVPRLLTEAPRLG